MPGSAVNQPPAAPAPDGPTLLAGARLLVDGAFLDGHALLLDGARIAGVVPEGARTEAPLVRLPAGTLLVPGLVDVQVNGGGGVLFNDAATPEAVLSAADAHRRLGTTAILPTVITDTPRAMRRAAEAVLEAAARPDSPVAGLHLEGPFLSPARPGIHRPDLIRAPDEADLLWLEGLRHALRGPLLLTVAPETVDDTALRRLAAAGITLSIGHTAASYERCTEAVAAGATGFTHLFNAMPPPAARAPGPVGAALLDPGSWCGVIADGIHVHPAMVRLLLAGRSADRIVLVSDAMSPVGTDLRGFTLQGRPILRQGGRLVAADGTLAGADICLLDAVRFVHRTLGVPSEAALRMASANPANFLELRELGRIAPGCRADLVLLDQDLQLLGTWQAGAWSGTPGVLRDAPATTAA